MSVRRGTPFFPIGIPTICWKTFPAKTKKMLYTRNSSILMMSSSEYFILESECSFTQYASSSLNTRHLYLRLPFFFENEGVTKNTSDSAFQFLVRNSRIKGRKIERLDAEINTNYNCSKLIVKKEKVPVGETKWSENTRKITRPVILYFLKRTLHKKT